MIFCLLFIKIILNTSQLCYRRFFDGRVDIGKPVPNMKCAHYKRERKTSDIKTRYGAAWLLRLVRIKPPSIPARACGAAEQVNWHARKIHGFD
jgi:hypothetical protein